MLQFGPIRMDVLLKKNVEKLLNEGKGDFAVTLLSFDGRESKVILRICESSLRFKDPHSDKSFGFDYSVGNRSTITTSERMLPLYGRSWTTHENWRGLQHLAKVSQSYYSRCIFIQP
jgi:hypothetical protein